MIHAMVESFTLLTLSQQKSLKKLKGRYMRTCFITFPVHASLTCSSVYANDVKLNHVLHGSYQVITALVTADLKYVLLVEIETDMGLDQIPVVVVNT